MTKDQFGIISQALNSLPQTKPQQVARVEYIILSRTDDPFNMSFMAPKIPNNPQGKPSLFVWRKNDHQIVELKGYLGMPLFIGDVISPLPNIGVLIQFLLGGRVNVRPENIIQIESEKDARVIKAKFDFSEFNTPKSSIRIQSAGGVMGIRG